MHCTVKIRSAGFSATCSGGVQGAAQTGGKKVCASCRFLSYTQFDFLKPDFPHTVTMSAPTVKLNNGHSMPLVGFGLWKVDNAVCADQVYNAIKTGYRLFDGACDYGNEKEVSKACRGVLAIFFVR